MDDARQAAALDPITLEIIGHGLVAIPNEIDANITRTAFSPLVYEYKDFASGLVDAEGRLVAQGSGSIPIFVANALGIAVRDGIAVHGIENLHDGDVLISNHAGTLGQHLNNVVMYTPVFDGSGELFGFMCVLVHWVDVGGSTVGSCSATDATEIFQEGIQFRSVKLWSKGARNDDIYRIVEINTRFPTMVLGDLDAQLAGTLTGKRKFRAMIDRYGAAIMRDAIEAIWDRSEQVARRGVRDLPDGVWRAESFLDNDGTDGDVPVPVGVEVRISGETMTIDLSGVGGVLRGPMNSGTYGGAWPAARIAFKILTAPDEPANEGCFRPLEIVIPDGTFLSAPATAPMGMYSATLATVIDTIAGAFARWASARSARPIRRARRADITRPSPCTGSSAPTRPTARSTSRSTPGMAAGERPRRGTAAGPTRRWRMATRSTSRSRCRRRFARCWSRPSGSAPIPPATASIAAVWARRKWSGCCPTQGSASRSTARSAGPGASTEAPTARAPTGG